MLESTLSNGKDFSEDPSSRSHTPSVQDISRNGHYEGGEPEDAKVPETPKENVAEQKA
jgi:hypothetical protein